MIISDLNYMEAAESNVEGGRRYSSPSRKNTFEFFKKIDTDVNVRLDVYKTVDSFSVVYGQLADAEAFAEAYGHDGLAETLTSTTVQKGYTSAYSGSISAR